MTSRPAEAVLFSVSRGVGSVVLNRPHVINALSLDMVRSITDVLVRWMRDDRVRTVVVTGSGRRGFCSGGDLQPEVADADAFLRAEYALDALIGEYPKPVVALLHGLVLGGGVGLSAHARIRVVTQDTRVGMPETRIGICPDVGATRLLARAPGGAGLLKALTSTTMTPAEALAFGFADHYVDRAAFDAIPAALREREGRDPAEVIAALDASASLDPVTVPEWVSDAMRGDDALSIVRRLESGPPDAQRAAMRIREMSPTAVAVTLRLIRDAESAGLRDALQREFEVLSALAARSDLAEGIRARIVDRDEPRWSPPDLESVDTDDVERILASRRPRLDFHRVVVGVPW